MRQKRTAQATIYEVFSDHELGRELQTMSTWLAPHPSERADGSDERPMPARFEAHRALRVVGRVSVALCGAQAASTTEL